ncbi:hypothetical protein U1Q18_045888 [Sarracenia purpurea var. burkii]
MVEVATRKKVGDGGNGEEGGAGRAGGNGEQIGEQSEMAEVAALGLRRRWRRWRRGRRVLVYFVLLWDLDLVWSWLCFDLELVLVVNEVFGIWNWFGAGPGVAWNRCWK